MHSRQLGFPASTVDHLTEGEFAAAPELSSLRELLARGWSWRGVALSAHFEDQFYRLNNLPRQLADLYLGLDEADPDEDIVEEVEEEAVALISQHYLLDETIDALYDSLTRLPGSVVVRRAGSAAGRVAGHPRAALLAIKHLFQDDWRTDSVMNRLAETASLAIDARPVLIGPAADHPDEEVSGRASEALGETVEAWVDEAGELTRVLPV